MSDNFSFDLLYNYTNRNISRCLDQAQKIQSKYSKTAYPGYSRMAPGEYKEGFFATLFLDIRGSTKRTIDLGPEKTLMTMQTLLPSLARIVFELDGGGFPHWLDKKWVKLRCKPLVFFKGRNPHGGSWDRIS